MASVDDRVVSMSFENTKFQAGVSQTLTSIGKLNTAMKGLGATSGLDNIEKASNKVTFGGLSSAIDKIKAKFHFPEADQGFSDVDKASGKVGFTGLSSAIDKIKGKFGFPEADQGFSDVEKASGKVGFTGLSSAIDKIKGKFGFPEADQGFSNIDAASNRVGFTGLSSAIDKIKSKFHFPEADQGFSDVEKAANKVSFGGITRSADSAFASVEHSSGQVTFHGLSRAIEGIAGQFSVIQGAAAVALGNIVSKATMAGGNLAKSLTIAPVTDGFNEYETQLNAVQTILSNTDGQRVSGLKNVNKALNELNTYADKTIYNFTEMAKNIGTFTAAGVDLKTATGSIKGIANLAALSGSNSQQASTAMYQLSQAISSGRVGLQDWNSVVNAGMGGAVFQKSLMRTAENMGALEKGAVKIDKATGKATVNGQSFRESIMAKPGEKSWLTGEVLTGTLKQLSGDMSTAQLKAEGYSKAQIKAIQKQAQMAVNAATQVKTLHGLLDTTKEAVGSGWAQTWQIVFGDFGEAKTLFTGLAGAIGGFVGASSKARNSVLKDWKELGGRKVLLDGLKNAFDALKSVVEPIKNAFRDIFPRKTGQDLYDMTVRFRDFMDRLKLGPDTMNSLRSTFKGFFAILDIGKQIVGGIFTAVGHMFGAMSSGSGGILHLTGNLGELITQLDNWLKRGDKIHNFFAGLGDVLGTPLRLIGSLTSKLAGIGGGNAAGNVSSSMRGIGDALTPAAKAADAATSAWEGFLKTLSKIGNVFKPIISAIGTAFNDLGDTIANAISGQSFDSVFTVLQTGLIAGIFLSIKKAISGGVSVDLGGGALKKVSESLDVLKGSLVAIQKNIQAHTLVLISTAVGILTASVVALSLISPEKLTKSMTAITVGMAQLMAAMSLMGKGAGKAAVLQMPVMAASLILFAAAVDTLAISMLMLSTISWEGIAKGLVAITGLLAIMDVAVKTMGKAGPGLVVTAAGIGALGIALTILSVPMKIFGAMKWEEIGKGLATIAASLIVIGVAAQALPMNLAITGAGLIVLSIGLTAIAGAVKLFSTMDWSTVGGGLLRIAAALVVIGASTALMSPLLPLTGAGLLIVGIGLTSVAGAIALMGNMDFGTLVKGITSLAVILAVLAAGMLGMIVALPGAAALLVISAALAIFVPTLGILGKMSWGTIAKGLAAIAASFLVMGTVGSLVGPAFVLLGLGMALLGGGMLLLGNGVLLLGKGLVLLGSEGAKGVGVLILALTALVATIPKMIITFLKGLIDIQASLIALAPKLVASLAVIIGLVLDAIIKEAPKLALAAIALITAVVKVIDEKSGDLIRAGWTLLINLLKGISSHIGQVTTQVVDIVAKMLTALAGRLPSLVAAGAEALAALLKGIANNIGKVVTSAVDVVVKFIGAIGDNIGRIPAAGVAMMGKLVGGIVKNAGDVASEGAKAIVKFVSGLGQNLTTVVTAGATAAGKFISGVSKSMSKLGEEGAKAVLAFLRATRATVDKYEPQIIQEGFLLGVAIVEGIAKGLAGLPKKLADKLIGPVKDGFNKAKGFLHAGSPSKLFMGLGQGISDGLAIGIDSSSQGAVDSSAAMALGVIQKFRDIFQIQSPSKVMRDLGKEVGAGFKEGLLGSQEEINTAFTDMDAKIRDQIQASHDRLSGLHDQLDSVHGKRRKKVKEEIDSEESLLSKLRAGHIELTKNLTDEKGLLLAKAQEYTDTAKKLDEAKTILENALKSRDDAIGGFKSQYGQLPEIVKTDAEGNPIDQLDTYKGALVNQANAIAAYHSTLDQLRQLGLDDATYQKLVSEGTADAEFAKQLLNAGPPAIAELNKLDSDLNIAASSLADSAGHALYDAGVKSAQGIVDGLDAKLNDPKNGIKKQMEKIASAMIHALKKKLHIKSPSREFMELGKFSADGLVVGLESSSRMVYDAASDVGDNALSALRNSMSRVSDALGNEIDMYPTITPILDLSQVQNEAKKMADLTNVTPITAAASYGLAASVLADQMAVSDSENTPGETPGPKIQLVQNNTSPVALNEAEIYRQTHNQLSQAKDALGL